VPVCTDVPGISSSAMLQAAESNDDPQQKETPPTVSTVYMDTDLVTQCCHELFSLFILAIAAEISSISGVTTRLETHSGEGVWMEDNTIRCLRQRHRSPSNYKARLWDNTLLTALAEQAIRSGLAIDLCEALSLVVPAFAHYGLLPPQTSSKGEQRDSGATERGVAGGEEEGGQSVQDGEVGQIEQA
jgi:hypothetical protein